MPSVKLGSKFFKKERDNLYSAWDVDFWRENFQNSIDAGATNIVVSIEAFGNGSRVVFRDNGCGMDRDTIENVFFTLGETTKEGASGIGGFGRARILTCFSMESYKIRTQNLLISGSGADYEIEQSDNFLRGCSFEIIVADKTPTAMMSAISKVLSHSQMDADVVVNDQRWTNWQYRRRLTRELPFGSIFVNNSQDSNGRVVVRVKGLYMFDVPTSAKPQVIVEIDPDRSRAILTINRDGLHYAYQNVLYTFLQEIAVDNKSALRERRRKTKLIVGRGMLSSVSSNLKFDANQPRMAANQPRMAADLVSVVNVSGDRQEPELRMLKAAMALMDCAPTMIVAGSAFAADLPSIYINDETENPKVAKIIANFDPMSWIHAIKNVNGKQSKYRKGSNHLKLLMVWREFCALAIDALMKVRNIDRVDWLIGWEFSTDEASHVSVSGGHALCLNPVDANGKLRYALTSRDDLCAMMALAKHEATHIVCSCHNEDFSTLHTFLDKKFSQSEGLRRAKMAIRAI